MSADEKLEVAKQYVAEQLKVLEQHGKSQKKLTTEQYNEMVAKVAKVITCK
jgi:hypothetical protein